MTVKLYTTKKKVATARPILFSKIPTKQYTALRNVIIHIKGIENDFADLVLYKVYI